VSARPERACPFDGKGLRKHFAAEAVAFVRHERRAILFNYLFAVCYIFSARLV
jgi:hypothetical protein